MKNKTCFETILTMAGKEVAVGKELKYFWNNNNDTIVKHRRNLVKTLIALHKAKRLSDKIVTVEGDYQVGEYLIPNIAWVKLFVNFNHRIYLTSVGAVDELFLDLELRDYFEEGSKVEALGEVVSPDAFKTLLRQISQYNRDWESVTEVVKHDVNFFDLHGFFGDTDYVVSNRSGDRGLSQFLGIKLKGFSRYGTFSDTLSDDALVRLITSAKVDNTEQNNN